MNTDTITIEELYFYKMTRQEREEKKKFNRVEYQREYYLKHKEYKKSLQSFHRNKKKEKL